ncbi:MAG: hypothetical protein F6K55_05445 [Moorea sp. SIO4A3]|nr:hypothetical protein [Moorena sp. SIO4A3]
MGASHFYGFIRWCVTGRAVPILGKMWKIRTSPSLTHPTPFLFFFTNMRCTHCFPLFPIPDSRFPIPCSLKH